MSNRCNNFLSPDAARKAKQNIIIKKHYQKLGTAPQATSVVFSKDWLARLKKQRTCKNQCFEIFRDFHNFAHPCLRPPQNLVLFLEAGEGSGKPGSALEGVGGLRGHPWGAQKQNKRKPQKSISVIFRYFREFCSSPFPVLFAEAGQAGEIRPVSASGWSTSALETPRGRRRWPVTPESTQDRYKTNFQKSIF